MSVFITNDELATFAKNGFDTAAVKRTIETYRGQGLDDNAIRAKIDNKLNVWGTSPEYTAEQMAKARTAGQDAKRAAESQHTPLERAADVTADFFGKTGVGRGITAILQGANKGNPLVQAASIVAPSVNDDVITPRNGLERALELGAEYAAPAGVISTGLGKIATKIPTTTKIGRITAKLLTPAAMPVEYASAAGAGALTGAVNPESMLGKLGTGVLGGMLGGAAANTYINRRQIIDWIRRPREISQNNAAYRTLDNAMGEGGLENAVRTAKERGVPLIDVGDENINQIARTARSVSPDANNAIAMRYNDIRNNAPSTVSKKINEIFGTENAEQYAKRVAEELDPDANQLYEMAFMGNTTVNPNTGRARTTTARLPKDAFAKLDKNPYIRDAINTAPNIHKELQVSGRKAIKDAAGKITGYEPTLAPRNDMRRLDFAKEVLDNQIAREKAAPAPNTRLIASLTNAKQDLVAAMDNFSPLYKQARAVSGQKLSALEAQKFGARIDRADMSADAFVNAVKGMNDREKSAVRTGVRDFYKKGFEQAENPAVFAKRLLDTDAKAKIRAVLQPDEANNLINFAETLVNQNRARNFILGGSRTAENQVGIANAVGAAEELASNPVKGVLRKAGRAIDSERGKRLYGEIANILLANPNTLRVPNLPNKTVMPNMVQGIKANNILGSPIYQAIINALNGNK